MVEINICCDFIFLGWWLTDAWQGTFPFAPFQPGVPIIYQFFPSWVIFCAQVVPIAWVAYKRRQLRKKTPQS